MVRVPPRLRHRLEREPSLAAELRQSIVFAAGPLFIAAVAVWGRAAGETPEDWSTIPRWVWIVIPLAALVILGFVGNVAVRTARLIRGAALTVEIDSDPLQPGRQATARFVEPAPDGLVRLEVYLIAEAVAVESVPVRSDGGGGWRLSEVVRFDLRLLTVTQEELRGCVALDREVEFEVPPEAADHAWHWQFLAVGSVARGVPRIDRYPVRIETRADPRSRYELVDRG